VQSIRYSCQILVKFEFYRQIFEKYSNIKLLKNPSGGSRVVLCVRTDRQTCEEATSRSSQFCASHIHSAWKHSNLNYDNPTSRPRNHTLCDIPPACMQFVFQVQWNLGSRTPFITNKSVHEQIFRTKNVSGDERCLK
jgi:hypothetical protein